MTILKRSFIIAIVGLLLIFSLTAFAQEEETIESFATGTEITGIVDELGEGYVIIDGVAYWLTTDISIDEFVVGESVSITIVLADDVTMSIISVEDYDGEVEDIDPNDNHPVGTALADGLGVTYEDIMGWADYEIGFGEIARAYLIANFAGIPVEEVFAQRLDTGAGWGEIMKQYDVSPSEFAPGRLISGKLVIAGIELPDDVDIDGTLNTEWAPDVTGIDFDPSDDVDDEEDVDDDEDDDEVASNQGNDGVNKFGCDGRGNSCNAPGQTKKLDDTDDSSDD